MPRVEQRHPGMFISYTALAGKSLQAFIGLDLPSSCGNKGGLGWGIHVNPWLIHVNVWQNSLQYCKVISLQLIKINEKNKLKIKTKTQPSKNNNNNSLIYPILQ